MEAHNRCSPRQLILVLTAVFAPSPVAAQATLSAKT